MSNNNLADELLSLTPGTARQDLLHQLPDLLNLQLVKELKARVDQLMRADRAAASDAAELALEVAAMTGEPEQRAVALLAKANVELVANGQFEQSIALYDEASELYRSLNMSLEQARSQIGKVAALANLGRYEEAISVGELVMAVLEENDRGDLVVGVASNLGMTYSHQGDDARSLELFDRALELHRAQRAEDESLACLLQMNRSFALRALGRYRESIEAGEFAVEGFTKLSEPAEAARARQHLAVTHYLIGNYARALDLLQRARDAFMADGRVYDTAVVDLFRTDCLLELRRLSEVVEICDAIRDRLAATGATELAAQAFVNESTALVQLGDSERALASLRQAEEIFEREDRQTWLRATRIRSAALQLEQGKASECLQIAGRLAEAFERQGLAVDAARAQLLASQAALDLGELDRSEQYLQQAADLVGKEQLPELTYQAGMVRCSIRTDQGRLREAFDSAIQAIGALEHLRGRAMLEHRISFLEDKAAAYAAAVRLGLALGEPETALDFAEQAKSRALMDLIAHRINVGITARGPEDRDLLLELNRLRADRDRKYRRWVSEVQTGQRSRTTLGSPDHPLALELRRDEERITRLWHRLLLRDADYARDAALRKSRPEPTLPSVRPGETLLEYFMFEGETSAFIITHRGISARTFRIELPTLLDLIYQFRLNLATAPRTSPSAIPALIRNANGLLEQMHDVVLGPVAELLPSRGPLTIVPHGPLHYVPFHALRANDRYLIQDRVVNYLPAASVLTFCRDVVPRSAQTLAIGYSAGGALPHAVSEAETVARLLRGRSLVEQQANLRLVSSLVPDCRIVHLATHGDFRADNPLFSGLSLADRELTVLDIFGLDLRAALVTLSACETGRSVVGGGDELLGLMRAFLAAGAASIVLSLWAVEDQSTEVLMRDFYAQLLIGSPKAEALRSAQLAMLSGDQNLSSATEHPYFWAPFVLVGDGGVLNRPESIESASESR